MPGLLVWPTVIFEIAAGLLILVGYKTRIVAAALAAYCLLTAAIFHSGISDQNQLINLLKNVAMAGGFMLLSSVGAGPISLDARSTPS
jgi:uncharacterized membrane protein YphA (DoxX/SURF4 family)